MLSFYADQRNSKGILNMKQCDFTLERSNKYLTQAVSKETLNFCSFITTGLNHNISVVGKYAPSALFDCFITLDSDLNCVYSNDFANFYYGVAPQIDSMLIIDSISKMRFSDLNGIDQFISTHSRCFMMHPTQKNIILDMARYIIIAYASNYGIKIRISPELLAIAISEDPTGKVITRDSDVIQIHGCPTKKIRTAFSGLRFSKDANSTWKVASEGGYSLDTIYEDVNNITLLNGATFYSGVLLKPLKFSYLKNCYENYNTATLCIEFERTTYATVFALDGNFLYHPLLEDIKETISNILFYDDTCKLHMAEQLAEVSTPDHLSENLLDPINKYLHDCINVNQIGVSGNIVTSDNKLLLGKRSGASIDSGFLYPGVNGNAEILDSNVSFYSYSVYADSPSILLNNGRIDFHGEIARETYAELRQDARCEDWICYGVTISGNISRNDPNEDGIYQCTSRRLHFNILFEQVIDQTFASVYNTTKMAVESFENEKLLGIEVYSYKNFSDYIIKLFSRVFGRIAESKDLVESILLLILFFSSPIQQHEIATGDWASKLSFALALIIVFTTLYRGIKRVAEVIRRQQQIRHILVFRKKTYDSLHRKIRRAVSGFHYHPVAYAALQLYVENHVFDEL